MKTHGYKELDHIADLALQVWGEDFFALLRQAAAGLYDLMGVRPIAEPGVRHEFQLANAAPESVLVDFLSELLYLAEDQNMHLTEYEFSETSDDFLVSAKAGRMKGYMQDIKAVTFHNLAITPTEDGIETIITFDV